jgi:hypothetical protein
MREGGEKRGENTSGLVVFAAIDRKPQSISILTVLLLVKVESEKFTVEERTYTAPP